MSNIQKGTRTTIIASGPNVTKGTIGTVEDIQNQIAVVRYGFDEERNQSLFVGVPISLLVQVTQGDLDGIDYKLLVDPIYHVGQIWRTNLGFSLNNDSEEQIVSIEDVKLAMNSRDDLFNIKVINSSISENHEIKRSVIEDYFIIYNPIFEESLAEEIPDGGETFEPCPGFRVFIKDTEKVAVLMEADDITRAVRLKYYEAGGIETLLDTTIDNIRPATRKEIESAPDYQIVDKLFRVGKRFKAKPEVKNVYELNKFISPDRTYELMKIEYIGEQVLDDRFIITDGEGVFALSTYYLYTYFIPLDDPDSAMNRSKNTKSQVTQSDSIEIDNISINNFRFSITQNGNIINKKDVNTKEIDAYVEALLKLKQMLNALG